MKRALLGCIVLLYTTITAFAQDRTISGKVTDENGEPLPGVSVQVKGTFIATSTDLEGNYELSVPEDATLLEFTFLGFVPKEIAIGEQAAINITLQEGSVALTEVVVTGLGISKEKKTLGYAQQNVAAEDIVNSREANFVNALAGKVAGVQINSSGGQAGSSSRIIIRGNTSLTGNNSPLFVINGVPVDNSTNRGISGAEESVLFNGMGGNRAIDIDPNIIEDVSVLKGAAATAIYGSRGANGVVLITTKRGTKYSGRKFPKVSLSSSFAFDNAFTDGYQSSYLQGSNGRYVNGLPRSFGGYSETGGGTQTSLSWGPHKDSVSQDVINAIGMPGVIDPRKDFYRNAQVWANSLSVTGGGDKSTYILTYSNLSQSGVVPNNEFVRNSITANFTSQLTEKLNTNTSVNYIRSENDRFSEGNNSRSFLYGLNFAPISFDNRAAYEEYGNVSWQSSDANPSGFNNPFWLVNNNAMPSVVDRFIVSNEITLNILPWLTVTNRVGLDTYTDEMAEHVNIGTRGTTNGRMFEALLKRSQLNNDLVLNAEGDINEDFSFTALLGHNYNSRSFSRRTVRGLGLSTPGFFDITNAETQQALQEDEKRRLIGLYAAGTLDFRDYLYLNLTARNDWSSTLPEENRSYFYPSVSLGFIFTDAFEINNKLFPYGKVRLSYAQAGNDADPYLTQQTFVQANPGDGTRGNITFPYDGINGFLLNNTMASNTLKPEIVTEIEFGTDLRFFESRLGIDFSYYHRKSENQILEQEISGASGFNTRVINAGEIVNKGIELMLTGTPVKTDNFSWDIDINFARNRYELKSIAEGVDNIFLGGFTSPQIRADKDYGYGVIWGQPFKRNENGDLLIDDGGYPLLADDLGPIGNVMPDWTGGIRNTFRYKNLSLSALIDIRQGGDILNFDLFYTTYYGTAKITEQRNTTTVWEGIRESDGQPNTTPVMQDQDYFQGWYTTSFETLVEDGSFIKLREVTLAYSLPKRLLDKTPFEGLRVFAAGRNLWIDSDFSYYDPEGSLLGNGNAQGFYHAVTPGTRGFTFGLDVDF